MTRGDTRKSIFKEEIICSNTLNLVFRMAIIDYGLKGGVACIPNIEAT